MLGREEYRASDAVGLAELVRSGEVTAREVLEAAPWIGRRPPDPS